MRLTLRHPLHLLYRKENHLDKRFYYTRQFARKATVTVRTLRYYDKVGLLSPSQYSKAGYRLYTDQDLLMLQQILALKFLGFSLEDIRTCLQIEPEHLQEILAVQKAMMREKRSQLDKIIETLEEAEKVTQAGQCNWESIIQVIQVMQMEQQKDWHEKYFTPEQSQMMKVLSESSYSEEAKRKLSARKEWTEADQKRVDEQYAFVKSELTRLVAVGADPASPEAQKVAEVKHELNTSFTRGDADIEAGLKQWWNGFDALPPEQRPIDMTMYTYSERENEFLNQALELYKQNIPDA